MVVVEWFKIFPRCCRLIDSCPDIVDKLALLKGQEFEIATINDLTEAFEEYLLHLGVKQY